MVTVYQSMKREQEEPRRNKLPCTETPGTRQRVEVTWASLLHVFLMLRPYIQSLKSLLQVWLWERKPYGKSRSFVRLIGSSLLRQHYIKSRFQIDREKPKPACCQESQVICTLADTAWIVNDTGDGCSQLRVELVNGDCPSGLSQQKSTNVFSCHKAIAQTREDSKLLDGNESFTSKHSAQRITALEAELALMRAQIAQLVTLQQLGPLPSSLPPPPPPLPPPPPPLPPPSLPFQNDSVIDVIRQRQANKTSSSQSNVMTRAPTEKFMNMMEVLKDMDKVKLRAVQRSPGGTPMRCKPATPHTDDPVALITSALRRKFSHRSPVTRENSPGKSDSWSPKEALPVLQFHHLKFEQHMLRNVNTGHL
uniref:mitochondrial fission regulator 1-like isoform X2 n=1 Tax=Myxine glutinosa TaxID=7769 RepID=UPI00358EE621